MDTLTMVCFALSLLGVIILIPAVFYVGIVLVVTIFEKISKKVRKMLDN